MELFYSYTPYVHKGRSLKLFWIELSLFNTGKRCVWSFAWSIHEAKFRISGFLENIGFLSEFFPMNIECSRENRINGCDKNGCDNPDFFSNFKWHPLTPIIYKFINFVWSFLQKNNMCTDYIGTLCCRRNISVEICLSRLKYWKRVYGACYGKFIYDGCNEKAKKKNLRLKRIYLILL